MLRIYSDGGSRGNPGHSAFAVIACKNDVIVHQYSQYIGIGTNNVAEYHGLIYAVGYALDAKDDNVEFIMDSKLVIEQMKGSYKVRAKNLLPMYQDVKAMLSNIRNVKFTHVLRSDKMITAVDALLNETLDKNIKP
jgi:ribonuclease HI